jgi:hypothetical protein
MGAISNSTSLPEASEALSLHQLSLTIKLHTRLFFVLQFVRRAKDRSLSQKKAAIAQPKYRIQT